MKLTKEEKKICKKYGLRDETGHVHCSECPLVISEPLLLCKAVCAEEEWEDFANQFAPEVFGGDDYDCDDADLEVGFNPYEGCYDYDC